MAFTREDDASVMIGELPVVLMDGKVTPADSVMLVTVVQDIVAKLNGAISHGGGLTGSRGNIDEQFIDYLTPSTPDTEFVLPHGLGRTPIGVQVAQIDQAGIVYASSQGSWDEHVLYLKCNVASANVKLQVY